MRTVLLVASLLLASMRADAAGSEQVSWTIGMGSWKTVSKSGQYTTQSIRYSKMQIRDQPVQFLIYGGYRSQQTGGHTFHELDLGAGARWLPKRPLAYSGKSGREVLRLTASAMLGLSIASLDMPMELSGGVAMCENTGRFRGFMFELAVRPAPESLEKHSNAVATPGRPGVVEMSPWAGMRFTGFW